MQNKPTLGIVLAAAVMMLPASAWAQDHDLTQGQPAAIEAFVEFGIVPTAPLGPPPCRQTAPFGLAVGASADPCVHKAHVLDQPEVTVFKGGQVTFTFRNGGHSIAIYEVSKDTTRDHIGQQLCPDTDPSTVQPDEHVCLSNALHASAEYVVIDGKGDVALHVSPNATNVFPENLVTFTPGRLMSAGGAVALNGAAPLGHVASYQFLKTGRIS